jgi:hypothetical protein
MSLAQAKSVLWIVDKPQNFGEFAGTLETDGHQVIVESEMSKTVPWLDRDVIDLSCSTTHLLATAFHSLRFKRPSGRLGNGLTVEVGLSGW